MRFNSAANAGLQFRAKEELPHEYTHTWQEWTHRFIDRTWLYRNERFLLRLRRLGIDCKQSIEHWTLVTFLDTSDFYGPHTNELLIGRAIAGRRDQAFLATKFGFVPNPSEAGQIVVDGSPAYIRKAIEGSLQRLGVETIDLYYQHRVDLNKSRRGRNRKRSSRPRNHRSPDRVLSLDPRSRVPVAPTTITNFL